MQPLGHVNPTGNIDTLSGHEPGGIGAQEYDYVGHVLGFLEAPERRLRNVVGDNPLGGNAA
jgi:hypothetical protein